MIQRSFQPRRKLQSDSDSDSGLFVIKDKLEARELVWWKETHIPAGRQTSEAGRVEVSQSKGGSAHIWPAARRHASLMSDCSDQQTWETLCLVREGKPRPAPPSPAEVMADPPEPERHSNDNNVHIHPEKKVPCSHDMTVLQQELSDAPRLQFTVLTYRRSENSSDLNFFFLTIILVCYWLVKQADTEPF